MHITQIVREFGQTGEAEHVTLLANLQQQPDVIAQSEMASAAS